MRYDGILMHKKTVYITNSNELMNLILKETHDILYVGHLGY